MLNPPKSELWNLTLLDTVNYFRYYNYAVWQDLTDLVALSDIAGA